jgi:hypothetical protein
MTKRPFSIGNAIDLQCLSRHSVASSLAVSSRRKCAPSKIYPLLLVSNATEIEVAPNTSPVEVAAKASRSSAILVARLELRPRSHH